MLNLLTRTFDERSGDLRGRVVGIYTPFSMADVSAARRLDHFVWPGPSPRNRRIQVYVRPPRTPMFIGQATAVFASDLPTIFRSGSDPADRGEELRREQTASHHHPDHLRRKRCRLAAALNHSGQSRLARP